MNKILVVDDELVIRKGIKKMVEKFPQKNWMFMLPVVD